MWNLKQNKNRQNIMKTAHIAREQMGGFQKGRDGKGVK